MSRHDAQQKAYAECVANGEHLKPRTLGSLLDVRAVDNIVRYCAHCNARWRDKP